MLSHSKLQRKNKIFSEELAQNEENNNIFKEFKFENEYSSLNSNETFYGYVEISSQMQAAKENNETNCSDEDEDEELGNSTISENLTNDSSIINIADYSFDIDEFANETLNEWSDDQDKKNSSLIKEKQNNKSSNNIQQNNEFKDSYDEEIYYDETNEPVGNFLTNEDIENYEEQLPAELNYTNLNGTEYNIVQSDTELEKQLKEIINE